jgi:hypothetical protein
MGSSVWPDFSIAQPNEQTAQLINGSSNLLNYVYPPFQGDAAVSSADGKDTYKFNQPVSMAAYLIALAASSSFHLKRHPIYPNHAPHHVVYCCFAVFNGRFSFRNVPVSVCLVLRAH